MVAQKTECQFVDSSTVKTQTIVKMHQIVLHAVLAKNLSQPLEF